MSDYDPTASTSNKKSKATLITVIIVVALVVVALAGYSYLAYTKDWWPFVATIAKEEQSTKAPQSLTISKLEVTGSGDNQVLQVGLKLKGEDKGYCVLELTSNQSGLKIDDNESRKNNKDLADFEDCVGWSVGVGKLPAGEYTTKVTFKGSNSVITTSKKVTIE